MRPVLRLRTVGPEPRLSEAGHQRAQGELAASFRRRGERTALARLRQAGCLKARLPYRPAGTNGAELVTLNISGGVAGGDALTTRIELEAGAELTVATQAAERLYRALPGSHPATIRSRLVLGPGAVLEWLPQETILFDGCALDRRLDVEMTGDARLLLVESLVFGRAAMGEEVRSAALRDLISVRREGRLVLHDAVRLQGHAAQILDRPATASGRRAVATILYVAPDAESWLEPLRGALPGESGASAWDRLLTARIVAGTAAQLRAGVVAALAALRSGRPLPRVWFC